MSRMYVKRTYGTEDVEVAVGFRKKGLNVRASLPASHQSLNLTYEQATILADALVDALDEQDEEPLT